jgi:predicted esterase
MAFTIYAVDADFTTYATIRSRVRVSRAEPGAPLVIALHGWGMSERSFERWLAPGIDSGGLSWWIPRGILPCEVRSRRIGYSWYVFDGDQEKLHAGMNEARAYLAGLVEMARRTLRPSHITLLGFSQGAYLGSHVALTRPDLFDRLVCCCGRPKPEFLDDLAGPRALRILVQTGANDTSVSSELIDRGVRPLREAGLSVEERSYDAAHRLTGEMAVDAADFAR